MALEKGYSIRKKKMLKGNYRAFKLKGFGNAERSENCSESGGYSLFVGALSYRQDGPLPGTCVPRVLLWNDYEKFSRGAILLLSRMN